VPRTRRLFPITFKREAVDRFVSSGLSPGKVAIELRHHETVLWRWVREAGIATTGLSSRPVVHALPPTPFDLAAENARLCRKVELLSMEREILKKTVTIFGAGQKWGSHSSMPTGRHGLSV
jgi:transposase